MQANRRDKPATRPELGRIFQEQNLDPNLWEQALDIAGFKPSRLEWRNFVDLLMLAMGTIFLMAGVFFFFAFNWEDMPKFGRFAVVEAGVIFATVLAFFFKLDTWAGRMALGSAAMLMGLALAVIGQAYQTGADNWQLFQMWCILITAWVVISRWNILYLIWMVLLNLSLALYWEQEISRDWQTLNFLIVGINLAFILIWDALARFSKFEFVKQGRWFIYIFAGWSLLHASGLMIDYIFASPDYRLLPMSPYIYVSLLAIFLATYTQMRRDLLMLTLNALSLLVVLVAWIGRILAEIFFVGSGDGIFIFFFIMTVITVGLTALMATLLRNIHQTWERES